MAENEDGEGTLASIFWNLRSMDVVQTEAFVLQCVGNSNPRCRNVTPFMTSLPMLQLEECMHFCKG